MKREPYQGAWVKHHRELLKLTQGELAEAVRADGGQLSRSHLANIEAGTYAAPADLIRVIATLRGIDVRDTWRHVGTLARTRNDRGPTLHQLSPVADIGPPSLPDVPDTPAPPNPHASATELLDWARKKLASLASGKPDKIVLTTAGPLADALRAAPPPGGHLDGLLGNGIRAVLEEDGELHHILAVPDDPEAHFELLAQALPLAARYCRPLSPSSSPSRPLLSRYSITLVPDLPAGPDIIATSHANQASMIAPIISAGQPGVAVVELAPQANHPGAAWARGYASWLAARGTDLFSWVTVAPAGTLNMPSGPWEDPLAGTQEHVGEQDSIQRMLRLNIMSEDLRSQLIAAQAKRSGLPSGSVGSEVRRRLSMYKARRGAMIRNLQNGYRYRNVVTREALHDLVQNGQYTLERLSDNVLTEEQTASYLQTVIDLVRSYYNFEVLILTDEQLQQALPLGASWIVKRSPGNRPASTERAWAFLPYVFNGKPMAMNVIVEDKRAVEAIGYRIDVLWATWAQGRTTEDIRQEAITELRRAQHMIAP
jgi:transcriptional regulator with XRE-family HTH domain